MIISLQNKYNFLENKNVITKQCQIQIYTLYLAFIFFKLYSILSYRLMPPSTRITCPVMYPAPGEARKATASAMS